MSYQTIYNQLRAAGLSEAGALGLMGNWDCESNCEPCRVQGDFSAARAVSNRYAYQVDNALMSESVFISDQLGWGLAQWTYFVRKRNLLRFCRARSISIANETAQVDFALHELRTEYPALFEYLCGTDDLYTATARVCKEYERPYINNIAERVSAAQRIKAQIDTGVTPAEPEAPPDTTPELDTPTTPFWPPRMLCEGMQGADVAVLQAHLRARGYTAPLSGVFDSDTGAALLDFQDKSDLAKDKVAGPKTWGKLLAR